MKKSDFIEVNVFTVNSNKKGVYGGGIIFSLEGLNLDTYEYSYEGKTLLTKDFFDRFSNDGVIDFAYVE